MKHILSLCSAILAVGCGPVVGAEPPETAIAAPSVPERFVVSLPSGVHQVSRYDIAEASEAQYEDQEFGTRMAVSLLTLDSSINGTLEVEARRMRRRGWKVHLLDEDVSDGMVSFVAQSPVRQSIVRAFAPPVCPTSFPCVALFSGSWPLGNSGEGTAICDYIQASFQVIPDRRSQ